MQGRHKKGFINPNVPNKQQIEDFLRVERSREEMIIKFKITWSTLRGLLDSYSEDLRIYEYAAKNKDGRQITVFGILRT